MNKLQDLLISLIKLLLEMFGQPRPVPTPPPLPPLEPPVGPSAPSSPEPSTTLPPIARPGTFRFETHPRTISNLAYIKPELRKVLVHKILPQMAALGWQPVIWEGLRTPAQQAEKVRLGYSKTLNSRHLSGKAVDIVDQRYLWNIGLDHQFWKDLGRIVNENSDQLLWGGDWGKGYDRYLRYLDKKERYFVDVAHIELL